MISKYVLSTLFCHTSLLLTAVVDPSGITGKYPGCSGRSNDELARIGYRDGRSTTPSKQFTSPPRSLWTDPIFLNLEMGFMDILVCWYCFNFG